MIREKMLWGFAAFCLLSGSGWVLSQAWPSRIGWPFASCIHYALIGIVAFAVAAIQSGWKRSRARQLLALDGAGLCLLVLPAAVLNFAASEVSEFTTATIFCAVPLMTVLVAGFWGMDGGEVSRLRGLMIPSVIGLGGALLLFPLSNPGSLWRWMFLGFVVGACVVVATASVLIHQLLKDVGIAEALAVMGVAFAIALGLWGVSVGWPAMGAKEIAGEVLRGAALDLPELWLLVWLMREVAPARLSARFLLVPLVTILERYTAEHVGLEWRQIVAAVLILAGGVMLLLREEPDEIPGLQLQ